MVYENGKSKLSGEMLASSCLRRIGSAISLYLKGGSIAHISFYVNVHIFYRAVDDLQKFVFVFNKCVM